MASAFGVLGENALIHAPDSRLEDRGNRIEREAGVLQLVVTDLARGLADAEDADEAVIDLVERSQRPRWGLDGLIAEARRKDIDFELRIASATGRLSS